MGKNIIIVHAVLKMVHIITWEKDHIAIGLSEGRLITHFTSSQRIALKQCNQL